jgi:heme A synthase
VTDFLLTAHAAWQYVALAAVVGSLVWTWRKSVPSSTKSTMYRLTAVVVDIQVAIGLVLWLADSGWSLGFVQGWLHPIVGLAAAGVLHAFVGRARKAEPAEIDRVVRTGLIIVLILVALAIGLAEAG